MPKQVGIYLRWQWKDAVRRWQGWDRHEVGNEDNPIFLISEPTRGTQSRCGVMRPFAESRSPYCSSQLVQGFVAVFVNAAVMSLTGSPNLMAGPCQLMADR